MRANEIIDESLSQPYEWQKNTSAGGTIYQWQMPGEAEKPRTGKCIFKLESPKDQRWGLLFNIDSDMRKTGGGDAFRIFATVVDCFKDWMQTEGKNANFIGFAADMREPSRVKLYDRFASMMPRFGWEPDDSYEAVIGKERFYDFKRAEQLNETMGSEPYPYKTWINGPYKVAYEFTTDDGSEVYVIFNNQAMFYRGVWDMEFQRDGTAEITGQGDALRVFSTVVQILKSFADRKAKQIKAIKFTAKEPSRIKLYDRLARRAAQWGFEVEEPESGVYLLKKADQLSEEVSMQDLNKVEAFADRLWSKFGIDINFTKHFFDRVNDPRNGKPISPAELVRIFKKEYEKHGKQIAGTDGEAVMKDTGTDVNLPFAKQGNKLSAKTIMRKKNFMTPDPEYVVNEQRRRK